MTSGTYVLVGRQNLALEMRKRSAVGKPGIRRLEKPPREVLLYALSPFKKLLEKNPPRMFVHFLSKSRKLACVCCTNKADCSEGWTLLAVTLDEDDFTSLEFSKQALFSFRMVSVGY